MRSAKSLPWPGRGMSQVPSALIRFGPDKPAFRFARVNLVAGMIISRLRLINWRNFPLVDVELRDRVFLVGANASGKSNLLDSIRFLRDVARSGGGLQPALQRRGGLSKIRCLSARRDPGVEIEIEITNGEHSVPWRYALGISQDVRGHRLQKVEFEKVWRGNELLLDRPDDQDQRDALRLTQTHLEQISANAEFRPIVDFLESIRYIHLVPQLLRAPESPTPATLIEDPFGRSLLEAIARTPEKTRKSRLKKIESALKHAVPQLTDLTDTKDESGVPHLEATYLHWRPNAGKQREDQFSDGTLRMIGLFWALLDGNSPLLLEEPELSLHGSIIRKLPSLFAAVQRKSKRQLFVSTHSADLLFDRGIGAEEVLVLAPQKEGTVVQPASSIASIHKALESGLSAGDVLPAHTQPHSLQQLELF